jgi:anti-sigma regulatory factor (Ser/Thr protein kinase)
VWEDIVFLRDLEMTLRERIANVGFTPMTAKALTGALSEIITNVWLHAHTSTPALVA